MLIFSHLFLVHMLRDAYTKMLRHLDAESPCERTACAYIRHRLQSQSLQSRLLCFLQPHNVVLRKAHSSVTYRLRTKPNLLLLRLYNLFGSQSELYADIRQVYLADFIHLISEFLVLMNFYFLCNSLSLVAQRIQIRIKRSITKYHTHTAVDTCKRFAENAEISIFFFGHFF